MACAFLVLMAFTVTFLVTDILALFKRILQDMDLDPLRRGPGVALACGTVTFTVAHACPETAKTRWHIWRPWAQAEKSQSLTEPVGGQDRTRTALSHAHMFELARRRPQIQNCRAMMGMRYGCALAKMCSFQESHPAGSRHSRRSPGTWPAQPS